MVTHRFDGPAGPDHEAAPHFVEQDVRRSLLAHPVLQFESLVVRRIAGGVCLEGIVVLQEELKDAASFEIHQMVAETCGRCGMRNVENRLVLWRDSGPNRPR